MGIKLTKPQTGAEIDRDWSEPVLLYPGKVKAANSALVPGKLSCQQVWDSLNSKKAELSTSKY